MILVDTSVWINWLRDRDDEPVQRLRAMILRGEVAVVPDLVLMEVTMGARDDGHTARIERNMRRFEVVAVGGEEVAREAARHYRRLRSLGVTIRSGVDMLIGTYCLRQDAALLHGDRDFAAMERHLGLRCL